MGRVDREAVRAMVERTCDEQGLPVKVATPWVVDQVSWLLGRTVGSGRGRSKSPDRLCASRINEAGAHMAGVDDDVLEDCFDDGSLPVQVEGDPLAS